jgi:RNA polymerase sigma-70 factor (ECF subfamily)
MGFSLAVHRSGFEGLGLGKSRQASAKMNEPRPVEAKSKPNPFNPAVAQPAQSVPLENLLVERCLNGDQGAFGELIELHQDKVYNVAYRILHNAEEADDATQEVFLKVWQSLKSFRGDSKFSTWLYRITHNHCLNRLRSAKSQPNTVSVEWYGDDEGDEREIVAHLPGDESENPSIRYETREHQQMLWGQVDKLPARYRSIIVLYYSQELSYEEIAEVLEVPVGTVKTHLFRAKAMLKTRLGDLSNQGIIDLG